MNYNWTKKPLRDAAIALVLAVVAAGCASQQSYQTAPPESATPSTPPPAASTTPTTPAGPTAGYGPSYTTFERDGVTYTKGSMAYPSGLRASSGLLLEKIVPQEVMVGQSFIYQYRVLNLTDFELADVTVTDQVTENFNASAAKPQPVNVSEGVAVWKLGRLEPNAEKYIQVQGSASEEGMVTTCGYATYNPLICESVNVVKADLKLVKRMPAEVVICDPIPVTLVVENTGSSVLNEVRLTDQLPNGLVAAGGGSSLSFDAGTLAPGQSREFSANVSATQTGKFQNTAQATSRQGVNAEDSATVVVRQPVLTIACTAPEERFVGRPVNVCFTVTNTGDAPSETTVVTASVPAAAVFQGATSGGRIVEGNVVWDVGTIAPDSSKEVCVTFTGTQPGTLQTTGMARGACAEAVSTSCSSQISGIAAILLEVIDLADPIEVGNNETYEIVVTNQGSAPATNVKIVCKLEDSQEYVSSTGASVGQADGKTINFQPVPSIPAKGKATWRVVVKALEEDDVRFTVTMTSDQIGRPVSETEATHQY